MDIIARIKAYSSRNVIQVTDNVLVRIGMNEAKLPASTPPSQGLML